MNTDTKMTKEDWRKRLAAAWRSLSPLSEPDSNRGGSMSHTEVERAYNEAQAYFKRVAADVAAENAEREEYNYDR